MGGLGLYMYVGATRDVGKLVSSSNQMDLIWSKST